MRVGVLVSILVLDDRMGEREETHLLLYLEQALLPIFSKRVIVPILESVTRSEGGMGWSRDRHNVGGEGGKVRDHSGPYVRGVQGPGRGGRGRRR